MLRLTLDEILKATGGKILCKENNDIITGISTDSRKIQKGDLFIPLIGENFDGHDYIKSALEQGASAALSQRDIGYFPGKTIIGVDNTLKALQNLAGYYRSKYSIPFIGITGSVGKTSTKEMVASALGVKYNVLKNEGNLNNEIGVPLTIFRLNESHEAAVVEMGMSGFGEIRALTEIVRPKVGIITNIGISHIEKLGSRQNILKAKLELLEGLQPGGLVILNGDDVLLSGVRGLLTERTVTYGLEEGTDYQAFNINSYGEKGVDFDVTVDGKNYTIHVPAPGIHNVYNALAAIAAGNELGVPVEEIAVGISRFNPGKMRLNIIKVNGMSVINDAYNSSPQSVKAALEVLREMEADRRIAVLGDMLELGEWSEKAHTDTGREAAKADIDYIITVGNSAMDIAKGAVEAGFSSKNTAAFMDNKSAAEHLKKLVRPRDAILVKGSRGMKMEEIVNSLTNEG